MDLRLFRDSLDRGVPPQGMGTALRALWYLAKGDWDRAHRLVQAEEDQSCAWVHAYLHRVEGDEANAGYWYRRAGRPPSRAPLERERDEIVSAL
jgi:hypothetical protein